MPTQLEDKPKQIYDDENNPGNERWFSGKKADPEQVKGMEEAFNKDSAKAEDLPDGHPDKDTLGKNDSTGPEGSASTVKSKVKRKLKGKQKVIIGGVIGTSVGGIMAVFGILGGPIQMVHLAQILGNASRPTDGMIRIRSGSMLRNARAAETGDVGAGRVSRIGYRVLGNARAQLQNIGVDFSTTAGSNRPNRITIDPMRHPRFQNRFPSVNEIATHYGVDPSRVTAANGPGARITIDIDGLNTGATRTLIDTTLSPLEDGKLQRSMNKRVMAKYFNVPSLFRPLVRASAEVENRINTRVQRRAAEKERRASRSAQLSAKYQDALEEMRSTVNSRARSLTRGAMLQGYLCAGAELYEIIPLVNYANVVVPSMLDATEKQAIGSQVQSGDDLDLNILNATLETMTYDAELSIQELNEVDQLQDFEEEELRAMDGKSIWSSKPLNALAYGGEGNGDEINVGYAGAFSGESPLSAYSFLGSGIVQDGVCNPLAQMVGVIAGLTTAFTPGPGWLVRGGVTAGQAALAIAISGIIRNFALERFTENAVEAFSGPQGGGLIAYGAMSANNLNATSMGGVALSPEQSTTLAMSAIDSEIRELEQKPFLARVFDPYDYRSVTGKVIYNSSQGVDNMVPQFVAVVTNPVKTISSAITSLSPRSYADTQTSSYDWGFPVFGIPPEILEDDRFENPYENERRIVDLLDNTENARTLLRLHDNDQLEDPLSDEEYDSLNRLVNYTDRKVDVRARVCFGVNIAKRGQWVATKENSVNPVEEEYTDLEKTNEECENLESKGWREVGTVNVSRPEAPSVSITATRDDWTRLILFIFDNSIVTVLDCYEGDRQSCSDIGISTGNTTTQTSSGGTALISGDRAFPLITSQAAIQNPEIFQDGTTRVYDHPYTAFDISVNPGTNVVAFMDGEVIGVGRDRCPGRLISVYNSDDDVTVTYMHLSMSGHVQRGEILRAGDFIGTVGGANEGCGTPHLHIDVISGRGRPACSRLSCPDDVKNRFIDIGPDLFELHQQLGIQAGDVNEP